MQCICINIMCAYVCILDEICVHIHHTITYMHINIYMRLYIYNLFIYIYYLFIYTVWYMLYIYTYTYIYIHMCVWSEVLTWWLLNRQWCYVRVSHPDIVWWSWARHVLEVHGSLQGFTTRIETYGYGSKPCTPGEHQNSW
jgi:hypothetical protein